VIYSPAFNAALAEQIRELCKDPKYHEACRALQDCWLLRRQIKACEEAK